MYMGQHHSLLASSTNLRQVTQRLKKLMLVTHFSTCLSSSGHCHVNNISNLSFCNKVYFQNTSKLFFFLMTMFFVFEFSSGQLWKMSFQSLTLLFTDDLIQKNNFLHHSTYCVVNFVNSIELIMNLINVT